MLAEATVAAVVDKNENDDVQKNIVVMDDATNTLAGRASAVRDSKIVEPKQLVAEETLLQNITKKSAETAILAAKCASAAAGVASGTAALYIAKSIAEERKQKLLREVKILDMAEEAAEDAAQHIEEEERQSRLNLSRAHARVIELRDYVKEAEEVKGFAAQDVESDGSDIDEDDYESLCRAENDLDDIRRKLQDALHTEKLLKEKMCEIENRAQNLEEEEEAAEEKAVAVENKASTFSEIANRLRSIEFTQYTAHR
jgi:hypothetical protein